jgi:hypothetical protein
MEDSSCYGLKELIELVYKVGGHEEQEAPASYLSTRHGTCPTTVTRVTSKHQHTSAPPKESN